MTAPRTRVLIVEDEAVTALALQADLASMGYDVVGIEDDRTGALARASRGDVDVVLMDINLKHGDDGVATAASIRQRVHIPIVYLTAYSDEATLARARATSPKGYVTKPYRGADIRAAIELALRSAGDDDALRHEVETAHRDFDTLAQSLHHDVRAPLRAIDGFTELLLSDPATRLDPAGEDGLRRVRAAAQRMGALIDGLLELNQIGRKPLERAEVDVTAMARDILTRMKRADADSRTTWRVEDGMRAFADPKLLRIALQALLENAWKFSRTRGAPLVEVGRERAPGGGDAFFVRDNGVGFDRAFASKLFAPYQRLHSAEEFPGEGLGLATVARIVSCHGGTVRAEGAPDAGATVHVTLPPA